MAAFQIRMTAPKQQSLTEIIQSIRTAGDGELVSEIRQDLDGCSLRLLVFEKYFMRAGGCISLTLLLTEQDSTQTADLVAAGGGDGLSYTFGASRSFAEEYAKALEVCGFRNVNPKQDPNIIHKVLDYFLD